MLPDDSQSPTPILREECSFSFTCSWASVMSSFPGHLLNLTVYMTMIKNLNFEALNILKLEQTKIRN
uniref:Uncharacterized protein n=1 Tax=Populus trichocarpa TaxID=3694 RepID=U5GKH0_POPTR